MLVRECRSQGRDRQAYRDDRYLLLQYLHFLHPYRSYSRRLADGHVGYLLNYLVSLFCHSRY